MLPRELLDILHVAERLKDTPRHCTTTKGRTESVAEHSWRVALTAYLIRYEFPELDMDKVIRMCLIHDLGECFTGDIPVFNKTNSDRTVEADLLDQWVGLFRRKYLPICRHCMRKWMHSRPEKPGSIKHLTNLKPSSSITNPLSVPGNRMSMN